MPAEGFFRRWSRLKTEPAPAATVGDGQLHDHTGPVTEVGLPAVQPGYAQQEGQGKGSLIRPLTLDDVAQLRADSDYSAFVARGVDKSVQRGALKKLFADPHFNAGDGLDLYMGDYNKPDPIPAAMMSALRHTQSFFAQAYPDKKPEREDAAATTGELAIEDEPAACAGELAIEDKTAACADELAIEDQSASPVRLTNPEPQMADTTGASSAASKDKA